tara:strand:+ start:559 stop:777 length:219 start_codon:yes stop_codon:yes gene_type:complete
MTLTDKYDEYSSGGLGVTTAEAITFDIMNELTGRSGFDGTWDYMDDEIREEVLEAMVKIVEHKTIGTIDNES